MHQPSHIQLPQSFDDASRVWIYQADRRFSKEERLQIENALQQFVEGWQSHGTPVKGFATLLYDQFILLMADETATGVSGCSTDSSVRLMKSLEASFNIDLFNRQQLAFWVNEAVTIIPLPNLQQAANDHIIQPGTVYFNNTILTKKELQENWMVAIEKSWLAKRISWPAFV